MAELDQAKVKGPHTMIGLKYPHISLYKSRTHSELPHASLSGLLCPRGPITRALLTPHGTAAG